MHWLMRTAGSAAVRKVVYVLVGLALAAALGAVGVRAAEEYAAFPATNTACEASTECKVVTFTHGPGAISATVVGTWSGATNLRIEIICNGQAAIVGAYVAANNSPSSSGSCSGSGLGRAYVWQVDGSRTYYVSSGGVTYQSAPAPTPTPTPTPTPAPSAPASPEPSVTPAPTPTPTPDPICQPHCIVALSDADRARLDDQFEMGAYGFGIVAFLLTATLVTVGLRR